MEHRSDTHRQCTAHHTPDHMRGGAASGQSMQCHRSFIVSRGFSLLFLHRPCTSCRRVSGGAAVTQTDILSKNAVIHVINQPMSIGGQAGQQQQAQPQPQQTPSSPAQAAQPPTPQQPQQQPQQLQQPTSTWQSNQQQQPGQQSALSQQSPVWMGPSENVYLNDQQQQQSAQSQQQPDQSSLQQPWSGGASQSGIAAGCAHESSQVCWIVDELPQPTTSTVANSSTRRIDPRRWIV
jgi:hypothetical protein